LNKEKTWKMQEKKRKEKNSHKPYYYFRSTSLAQVMQLHPHFCPLVFFSCPWIYPGLKTHQHGYHWANSCICL
jgi:hypothetical protein